jgi:hypothetical protein
MKTAKREKQGAERTKPSLITAVIFYSGLMQARDRGQGQGVSPRVVAGLRRHSAWEGRWHMLFWTEMSKGVDIPLPSLSLSLHLPTHAHTSSLSLSFGVRMGMCPRRSLPLVKWAVAGPVSPDLSLALGSPFFIEDRRESKRRSHCGFSQR